MESSNASQPCAIVCIHVPMSETVWPIQNSRKFRWRWSVWNGLSDETTALAAGVSTAAEGGAARRDGGAVVGSGTIEKYSRRSAHCHRMR